MEKGVDVMEGNGIVATRVEAGTFCRQSVGPDHTAEVFTFSLLTLSLESLLPDVTLMQLSLFKNVQLME